MMAFVACALCLLSSYLLFLGWKAHKGVPTIFGWISLLASFYFWKLGYGGEFGLIFCLGILAIGVWIWIISQYKKQDDSVICKQPKSLQWNTPKVLQNTAWILHHFILLMIISSLLTIALLHLLPLERTIQIATGIICIPIVWAVLSCWQLITVKPWHTFTISLLGGTASALYLFI